MINRACYTFCAVLLCLSGQTQVATSLASEATRLADLSCFAPSPSLDLGVRRESSISTNLVTLRAQDRRQLGFQIWPASPPSFSDWDLPVSEFIAEGTYLAKDVGAQAKKLSLKIKKALKYEIYY